MALTDSQIEEFRALIAQSKKPLILFDDDCDGTTSFVMLYHAIGAGRGLPVKRTPLPVEPFLRKVREYEPDMVFILDKPQCDQEFLDGITVPVVWLDHHEPQKVPGHVRYFNPRIADDNDNNPTSYWMYKIVANEKDLWLAAIGTVGDWHVPEFLDDLKKQHPDLLPETWEGIEDLYIGTRLGELIKILNFNLKGTVADMLGSIKTLIRVENPHEILDRTTARGRYLWRKYRSKAKHFENVMVDVDKEAKKQKDSAFLIFEYVNDEQSFTSELSNELILKYPKKIIVIARHHEGDVKASLRSYAGGPAIDSVVKTAREGIPGTGGGHTHACGACIPEEHWPTFLERFERALER